jgi:hypothetical protein
MTSPIKPIMSCERFNDSLADFLEHDVPASARAEMEAHALSCAECGPLLADLRQLRIDAANLEPLAPSRDLWAGIAARIEAPVVSIGTSANEVRHGAARRRTTIWAGLAAAGLVAVTATATYQITKQSLGNRTPVVTTVNRPAPVVATLSSPADTANAPSSESAAPRKVESAPAAATPVVKVALASNPTGKLSAAETYAAEISRLRRVVNRRRNDLDSATVAVLEKNLHIIDDAIAQCRKALEKDPSSAYLNESLTEALDNKVELLRAAATLPVGL